MLIEHYRTHGIYKDSEGVYIPCFQSYRSDFESIEEAKAAIDKQHALESWMDYHYSSQGFHDIYKEKLEDWLSTHTDVEGFQAAWVQYLQNSATETGKPAAVNAA